MLDICRMINEQVFAGDLMMEWVAALLWVMEPDDANKCSFCFLSSSELVDCLRTCFGGFSSALSCFPFAHLSAQILRKVRCHTFTRRHTMLRAVLSRSGSPDQWALCELHGSAAGVSRNKTTEIKDGRSRCVVFFAVAPSDRTTALTFSGFKSCEIWDFMIVERHIWNERLREMITGSLQLRGSDFSPEYLLIVVSDSGLNLLFRAVWKPGFVPWARVTDHFWTDVSSPLKKRNLLTPLFCKTDSKCSNKPAEWCWYEPDLWPRCLHRFWGGGGWSHHEQARRFAFRKWISKHVPVFYFSLCKVVDFCLLSFFCFCLNQKIISHTVTLSLFCFLLLWIVKMLNWLKHWCKYWLMDDELRAKLPS